jgi:hypothetical protein
VAPNEYQFQTHWRVSGTAREVSGLLEEPTDLPRWWPAVYLDVVERARGDERGIGRTADLHTRGWLPYTLRWRLRVTASRSPHGFSLEATGDFVGRGVWTFTQDGRFVDVTYDWRLRAEKPLLRRLSFILKPVFAANHRWAMARGQESLRLELARRRHAASTAEAVRVPPPPAAPRWGMRAALVTAALGVLLLARRLRARLKGLL